MNKKNIKRAVLEVKDISCSNCAFTIENHLKKIKGIFSVSVHVITKMVIVRYDSDNLDLEGIKSAIRSAGYTPGNVYETERSLKEFDETFVEEEKKYFVKFLLAVIVSLFLFFVHSVSDYMAFVLSFFVWVYCGWHFHKGFYYSIKNLSADMNTLVSLSSTVMLVYISYSAFYASHNHFFHWHEISMLIGFINLGKYFESKTKCDVSRSIKKIASFFPKTAIKVENGKEREIKVVEIKKGDIILLKPGMEVPVDGIIEEGTSYFDLRQITGESLPVFKKRGDFIYSGSINSSGAVKIKSVNVGEDTTIAKLINAISDAQSVKLNIQKKVDKISRYFVPSVIFIALVSAALWYRIDKNMGVNVFAAILAVSCPCAMGLSVPIAAMVGLSRAIKLGFIINNPLVIENFSKADVVLLDKTGTLTEGDMNLSKIKPFKIEGMEFLKILLTAEYNSEHVFADSIKRYCRYKNIQNYKIFDFKNYVGEGVECHSEIGTIKAGSPYFFDKNAIDFSVHKKEINESIYPCVLLALEDKYMGYAVFKDPLRRNAKEVIKKFIELNIKPVVISGDRREVVKETANLLGIEEYYFELKPDEKQSVVLKYKMDGKKVMMIGDGINDSAAINEADIGISMKTSKEITSTVSDMVLLTDDISSVFKIIRLSENIKKIINQNLFWAFSYNIVLIPLSAGVLYHINGFFIKPYMAALAMGLSSVSVVLNSVRLLKIKI